MYYKAPKEKIALRNKTNTPRNEGVVQLVPPVIAPPAAEEGDKIVRAHHLLMQLDFSKLYIFLLFTKIQVPKGSRNKLDLIIFSE